jgi:hypothetical protein
MRSHEVVSVVRLMPLDRLREAAKVVGSDGDRRLDVIYTCLKSRRARRALRDFLYSDDALATPRHGGDGGGDCMSVGSPPPPPPRPVRHPRAVRRLDFDDM